MERENSLENKTKGIPSYLVEFADKVEEATGEFVRGYDSWMDYLEEKFLPVSATEEIGPHEAGVRVDKLNRLGSAVEYAYTIFGGENEVVWGLDRMIYEHISKPENGWGWGALTIHEIVNRMNHFHGTRGKIRTITEQSRKNINHSTLVSISEVYKQRRKFLVSLRKTIHNYLDRDSLYEINR